MLDLFFFLGRSSFSLEDSIVGYRPCHFRAMTNLAPSFPVLFDFLLYIIFLTDFLLVSISIIHLKCSLGDHRWPTVAGFFLWRTCPVLIDLIDCFQVSLIFVCSRIQLATFWQHHVMFNMIPSWARCIVRSFKVCFLMRSHVFMFSLHRQQLAVYIVHILDVFWKFVMSGILKTELISKNYS